MDADVLSGVARAVEGFASGWERGQDRKLKQMEIESKINAEKESKARQKTKDEMEFKDKEFDNRMKVIQQNRKLPSGLTGSVADLDLSTLPLDTEALKAKSDNNPMAQAIRSLQLSKEQDDAQKRHFEKTTEGKVSKLSGDQRKRFDDVTGSLDALGGIKAAYSAKPRKNVGDNSDLMDVPFRGDTDYTVARNLFTESIGRMQSGGAIGEKEAISFKQLIPTAVDTPEIAQNKIAQLEFLLNARLKSFGVSKEDAVKSGFLQDRGLVKQGLVGGAPQDAEAVKRQRLQELEAKAAGG